MRPRHLTGLGARRPDPPVHRCHCGCGQTASLGYPGERWYVPGHQPAAGRPDPEEAMAARAPRAAAPAADLFETARVFAPRRRRPT